MAAVFLRAAADPLHEQLLVAATGPAVTVLFGGLAVWFVTRRFEQKREDRLRERDENREDAQAARELRARDDALRHELVTMMTECASTLYLAMQHFDRTRRNVDATPDDADGQRELADFRAELDRQYLKTRASGQALEYRLLGYYVDAEQSRWWHRVQDLLTVRYFQLTEQVTPAMLGRNAGEEHTGLTERQLADPEAVKEAYHAAMHRAVGLVFEGDLRARSEESPKRERLSR